MINWRKPTIFVLLYLSGSKIPRNLRIIQKLVKSSKREIRKYQEEKLKKLLFHAYKNVPYYQKVLGRTNVVVDEKVYLENFIKIPILTKKVLKNEFENLKSHDMQKRGWYLNTSGGSTGEPVKFVQDKKYSDWNIANKIYYKSIGGQAIGDKEMRLWGSERDLLANREKTQVNLKNWLYNRKEFNVFKMSQSRLSKLSHDWNKYKPKWVESYVQPMYEFALYVEKNNIRMHSPRGILTSAGTLFPHYRKKIEEVFNCLVFNRYGSREVGDMACSCGLGDKLHLSPWNHYLEIADDKKTNNRGSVYVTTLNNYAMPLIRYDIGDAAVRETAKCICGRKTPLLRQVVGRKTDVFKTRQGKIVPAEFFIHFIGVVFNENIVEKFQVIQEDYEEIKIKVVARDKTKLSRDKKKIELSVKKVMGSRCVVKWKIVKNIPNNKNGKYSYTICKIK